MTEMKLGSVHSFVEGTAVSFYYNVEGVALDFPGDIFFDSNNNKILDTDDQKTAWCGGYTSHYADEEPYCTRDVEPEDISRYGGIVDAELEKAAYFREHVYSIATPTSQGSCFFMTANEEDYSISGAMDFKFDRPFSLSTLYSPDSPNNYTFEKALELYRNARDEGELATIDPSRCNSEAHITVVLKEPSFFINDNTELSMWIYRDRGLRHDVLYSDDWLAKIFGIQVRPNLYNIDYDIDGVSYRHNDVTAQGTVDSNQ